MDKVTIIIPAYNAEKTIEKCLDSIVKQSYKNLEILIINDGSSDRTEEICNQYAKFDSRIQVYSQENTGVSAARNKGISMATGRFLQFVDADDYIDQIMTEELVKKAHEFESAQLIVCGCMEDREGVEKVIPTFAKEKMEKIELLRALLEPDSIRGYLVNKLFYRKILLDNKVQMRTDIHVCEDLIFCLEYAEYVESAIYIDKPYYHYVFRHDSVTHKKFSPKRFSTIQAFEEIKIIAQHYKDRKLNSMVEAHYLVLIIQLFVMLKRNHYSMKTKEMKMIMSNMKKRKLCLWGTQWDIKYKVTCLPIKLLSFIYG